MKIIKGCLTALFVFSLICILLFWSYKSNILEKSESLSSQVDKQWEKTAKLVAAKNSQLKTESNISDSLKFYLQEFDKKSNIQYCDSNFINFEYAINRLALIENLKQENILELNVNSNKYNSLVRSYNTQRNIFPTSIILKNSGLKDHYKYFEIEYGVQNESPQQKRRKTREWQKKIEDSILK